MIGLQLCVNDQGVVDIATRDGDLAVGFAIPEAVFISLFTDRRCAPEDLPSGETDRRGCWSDGVRATPAANSLLWLFERVKNLPETPAKLRQAAEQALAWLVDAGHVRGIEVAVERLDIDALRLVVTVALLDGDTWSDEWRL